jgi:hypothetical protein
VLYEDGDFEKFVPVARLKLKDRPTEGDLPQKAAEVSRADMYGVGEVVLGDWKGRGKMYQGWITAVHASSGSTPPSYTVSAPLHRKRMHVRYRSAVEIVVRVG